MVDVLVIPDGASEPVGAGPTALERARTPVLDALCSAGTLQRVATTPDGWAPGSETGLPTLLGARPVAAIGRGLLEAAAAGIEVPAGSRAWRCDVHARPGGARAGAHTARAAARALAVALPSHAVHHLRGHRLLVIGVDPPVPGALLPGLDLRVWGDGALLAGDGAGTPMVVVSGPGAAAGCARLLGAELVLPAGATGGPDTDLRAKREAALGAVAAGGVRVVVHVGAPDEAAHARDPDGKAAALEAVDRELLGPLWAAVHARGGRLAVCPDHGTDPATGEHCGAPVPGVCATAAPAGHAPHGAAAGVRGDAAASGASRLRMTERDAASRPLTDSPWSAT